MAMLSETGCFYNTGKDYNASGGGADANDSQDPLNQTPPDEQRRELW